jgi:hypothetical protein
LSGAWFCGEQMRSSPRERIRALVHVLALELPQLSK